MACDTTYYHASVAKLAYFRMIRETQSRKVQPPADADHKPAQAVVVYLQTANSTDNGCGVTCWLNMNHPTKVLSYRYPQATDN